MSLTPNSMPPDLPTDGSINHFVMFRLKLVKVLSLNFYFFIFCILTIFILLLAKKSLSKHLLLGFPNPIAF
jgi:hypothetical protein